MKYCMVLCLLMGLLSSSAQWKIIVKNPTSKERKNELVRISRKKMAVIADLKVENKSFFSILSNGKSVIGQTVDLDGDENWDELVFSDDFLAKETKTIEIKLSSEKRVGGIDSFAHARLKPMLPNGSFGANVTYLEMPNQNPPTDFSKNHLPPYLTEGPAWENDKNAFRLYFDTRNTKDIYGKRQPHLVMDSVGSNTKHSYHNLSDWGMDILHVEKSMGAGSLALQLKDANGNDTLIRLGGNDVLKETYHLLNDGPIYASFRMDYSWNVLGKKVLLSETIGIWKGQYFYESNIRYTVQDAHSTLDKDILVAGIADFFQNKVDSLKDKNITTLYSYGKQSEHKDELGMAIMAPTDNVAFLKEAPFANSDITKTHLLGEKIAKGEVNTFRFYSCWILTDPDIVNSEDSFKNFLKDEMVKYAHPLLLNYLN